MKTPLIGTQPKTDAVRSIRGLTGNRRGMTLVEMLVATTCTLILMGLVGQLFGVFGNAVSGSREVMQLDAEMRSVAWRLRQDLKGVTAPTLPPLDPDDGQGYFEYIDGPMRDFGLAAGQPPGGLADLTRLFGDCDDVLLFTTRSSTAPFVGKFGSDSIESDTAEVAWFLRPAGDTYSLYRKQLLVVGNVGSGVFSQYGNRMPVVAAIEDTNMNGIIDGAETDAGGDTLINGPWQQFYEQYDVAVRAEPDVGISGYWVTPCTLSDLTNRENRFLHHYGPFDPTLSKSPWAMGLGNCRIRTGASSQNPLGNDLWYPYMFPTFDSTPHHFQATNPPPGLIYRGVLVFDVVSSSWSVVASSRVGEDVVLTNVIGFDVKAYDPAAQVRSLSGTPTLPGDPGYLVNLASSPSPVTPAAGCYVDLRYDDRVSPFTIFPDPRVPGAVGASAFSTVGQRIHSGVSTNMVNHNLLASGILPQFPVYDTWSAGYESNNLDEDQDLIPDEGVDGQDNDVDGFVDEGFMAASAAPASEQETAPPYPFPLRGIEIRLRCYEPRSRQVRQVTVRHTFVPH